MIEESRIAFILLAALVIIIPSSYFLLEHKDRSWNIRAVKIRIFLSLLLGTFLFLIDSTRLSAAMIKISMKVNEGGGDFIESSTGSSRFSWRSLRTLEPYEWSIGIGASSIEVFIHELYHRGEISFIHFNWKDFHS